MEYVIKNLTKEELDIMESSNVDWCPDDMSGENTDITVFSEEDYIEASYLLGRE